MNDQEHVTGLVAALRPNLFEKAIQKIAPIYAAKRMKARASIAWGQGYIGARFDRNQTKTWYAPHLAADETMLWDLITLRARSRDLVRNAPIARGAVKTVVTNVVGSGLKLQACPDTEALGLSDDQSAALKKTIEREFRLFADTTDCDVNRRQTFYGLQSLAFLSALEGGDSFALLPMVSRTNAVYQTCIQLIEAERVANPVGQSDSVNMRAGIEIDDSGMPTKYHVRKFHPFSTAGTIDQSDIAVDAFGKKTGRRNILHLIDTERPGQTRGVPYLAPVMEPLKMLDRYAEAELSAAVISAMFTVFITTPTGDGLLGDSDIATASTDGVKSALGPNDVALGSGSIIDLMPGEEPKFANPARPNANFDSFVQAVIRQIGIALQIPFEVLIKHFTASYSAARAALLDAWTFFYNRREWLTTVFCQPVFETWFEEAVAAGRIDAPGFFDDPAIRRAYLKAEWIGDAPVSMDPLKDAQAAAARLGSKLSSRSAECLALTGRPFDDVVPELVREKEMLTEAGLLASLSNETATV
jgi:lambda family phage portal protein